MGKVMNPLKSLIKKPLDVGVRIINSLLTVAKVEGSELCWFRGW